MSKLPKLVGIPKPTTKLPTNLRLNLIDNKENGRIDGNVGNGRVGLKRRSVSCAEFKRPLRSQLLGATMSRNGIKRIAPSVTDVKPKMIKPNVTKPVLKPNVSKPNATRSNTSIKPSVTSVRTKSPKKNIVKKPAPYDYKARFGLLQEKHTKTITTLQEMKEKLTIAEDSAEELTTENETIKNELAIAINELKILRSRSEQQENELKTLKPELERLKSEFETIELELRKTKTELQQIRSERNDLKSENERIKSENTNLRNDLRFNKELVEEYKQREQKFDIDRRKLHNEIQDLKGNIRVFCRIRPPIETQRLLYTINYLDESSIEIRNGKESIEPTGRPRLARYEFSFDKVFAPETLQSDVFVELSQLVQSALDGYNVCVFAYGQTGSGKTYTMEGGSTSETLGMIPRAVDLIFDSFEHMKKIGWAYNIQASFLEIYNEKIHDLLDNKKKSDLEIRMTDPKGTDVYVTNLTTQTITSAIELKKCMNIAQRNRAVAATENNERSSRSHSVTKILLEGVNEIRNERIRSSLNLIDLAGSEKVQTIGTSRLEETKNINKSLSILGQVILSLQQKNDHIPYRNCKLTHLLMPCLGGNSKTLMMVNISPFEECFNESVNSLRFATNVNQCKTGQIKKNKVMKPPDTPKNDLRVKSLERTYSNL